MSDVVIPLILKKLCEETDEQHRLTYDDLIKYLDGEGIEIHRAALGNKIHAIQEIYPEVKQVHRVPQPADEGDPRYGPGVYYKKEVPAEDVLMLMDLIDSNQTMPPEERESLKRAARRIFNPLERSQLIRPQVVPAAGTQDRAFRNKVNAIRKAINNHSCIRFYHYHYNHSLQLVRAENEQETVSPALLKENENHIYLVAVAPRRPNPVLRFFRLDLIGDIEACPDGEYIEMHRVPGHEANINLGRLMMNSPFMEAGEDVQRVEFVCDETFLDTLIGILGREIRIEVLEHSKLNWFLSCSFENQHIYENIQETPGDKPGWHLQKDPSVPLLKVTAKMSRVEALELASRYPLDLVLVSPEEWKNEMTDKLLKISSLLYEDVAQALGR